MSTSTIIPADILQGTADNSIKISRVPVRVQSDTASYNLNQTVRFTLPNDFCDLRGSYLTFYAQATQNGGTYLRFSFPVGCIFNRARIYLGSQLVEDILDYNVLRGLFYLASDITSVTTMLTEGTYTNANRANDTTIGRNYTVRLRLESLERVWPLHKLKLPLRIELTIGDAPSILEYDGAAPVAGIQFNNAYFNYYSMQVPSEVDAMLNAQIASGQAKVRIHTYDNYNTTVASSTSATLMLPFKHKCVNGLFGLYRLNAEVSSPTTTNKFLDNFSNPAYLIQTYAKIGNQIFPSDKYEMSTGGAAGAGFYMLQIPFNNMMYQDFHAHDRQGSIFMGAAPTDRVVVPIDTRRDSGVNAALWDNGIDTSTSATSSQFGFTWTGATGDLSIDVFCKYEAVITILPGGDILLDN